MKGVVHSEIFKRNLYLGMEGVLNIGKIQPDIKVEPRVLGSYLHRS